LNPKSKGLIKAILIGPGPGPETDGLNILKICPRPGTGGSRISEKKEGKRPGPSGSTKNQEPANTGLNWGPYLKTHVPRMSCTREPSHLNKQFLSWES
jgi:hypothetical protein